MYVGPEPRKGRNVCPKPWKSSRLLKRRRRRDWRFFSSSGGRSTYVYLIDLLMLCSSKLLRLMSCYHRVALVSLRQPTTWVCRESVEEVPLGLSHWGTFVCCEYLMFVLAPCGYCNVRWVCPGGTRRPAQSSGRGRRPGHDRGAKPVLTLLSIRAFRLILCQEIVKNQEHPRLDLLYEFEMTVYCFPNPDDPAQVFYMLFTYCCVGWTHPTTRNRL